MFELPPLVILLVGVVTVIGLIVALKLNAFLALITAAIVVSLLAPGDIADKIARVAAAFGSSAGSIAVVIALAAIIGKCMMDSGAADRVVRSFLNVLGEKRAPTALMGSGFVLAVPVFFDTVFYLLVPLARSLFRRTQRNYLKYILAIAAGGAITHTLVPPTPGPLLMASNLNIDVGVMIMIGGLVALPAAVVGLFFAGLADRIMPIPMRPLAGVQEPEPLADDQLPGLFLSLLPVLLPVVLISANTVLKTLADQEHAALLKTEEIQDYEGLIADLRSAANSDAERLRPARGILESLPGGLQSKLTDPSAEELEREDLVAALNEHVLQDKQFYNPAEPTFDHVLMTTARIDAALEQSPSPERAAELRRLKELNALLAADLARMDKALVERMNRLLLEVSYPEHFRPHVWTTPLREAADVSSLFGNANLALLLSTIVAMWTLYRQRQPTRVELANSIEIALMSGGVIILITAAGGAFGAMLKEAQIGPAIQDMFRDPSGGEQVSGMVFLFLGFGLAALLKFAQGSSTVAMITASAMLAAMIGGVSLPFNVVYLATAIGAGSLVGSWMNDSGFWIFAKMGGLTEVEALKSWTILLVFLGLISMGVTLLLASFLPLTTLS